MGDNFISYQDILHLHCADCYKVSCTVQQNCKIIKCQFGCGMSHHKCKTVDHEIVCTMMPRLCPNASYGCPYKMPRCQFAKHLDVCPASAIHCGMEWNRYPVYSEARKNWLPFVEANPPKIKGQLDIELAFNDQKKLEVENYKKMKSGNQKASKYQNRKKVEKERIKKLEILMGNANDICVSDIYQYDCDFGITNHSDANLCCMTEVGDKVIVSDQEHKLESLECSNASSVRNLDDQQVLIKKSHDQSRLDSNQGECDAEMCSALAEESKESAEAVITVTAQDNDLVKMSVLVENTDYQITGFPKQYSDVVASPYFTKHLGLNVMIETIPKFQSNSPMYSIPCQTYLRRDQYCSHFKNVHSDIHGGLNTWIQERCPLAQYGCPFIRCRLKPASKEGCLVFDHDIGGFALRPEPLTNADISLALFPFDLLEKIAECLDSFSIIQFSKTCKVFRDVCQSLVQRKGIVLLAWKRGSYPDGSISWKTYKQRWLFTPSFSYIKNWIFTDEPSLGDHLSRCPFYDRTRRCQKFKIPTEGVEEVKLN